MKELYIETKNGDIPIEKDIIKKHDLKRGTLSPFTGERIVGKNGDFRPEPVKNESPLDNLIHRDDGIDEMENGMSLSTSEILDFAEGTDNSME